MSGPIVRRRLFLASAGFVASFLGVVVFAEGAFENRDALAYLGIAISAGGALSAVIAALLTRSRLVIGAAIVSSLPLIFLLWSLWRLATDPS
jgi:hypothetical protein